jgi:drug/metabolite transporter (DMT)-like permease
MIQKHANNKYLAIGMVLSMFLWGLSWPSGKVLTNYCSAINFTVYRYFFVVATMLLLLPILGTRFRIHKKGIPAIIASGVLLAVYSYLFFMGIKKGSPGAGGVLVTTLNPIMAYAIGFGLKRSLPSRKEGLGLLLGLLAGLVLLKVWDNKVLLGGGNLYFLLAAFTWAAMSKFTAQGAMHGSSMSFSLWQYLVTLLCLLPLTNFTEMQAAIHIPDPLFWLNLLFGSVIVTAMATTVYFYTTTRLGAERASSFIFLVPFAAAISSWAFLGEKILPHTIVGGLLGIAAVYIINRKKRTAPSGKKV